MVYNEPKIQFYGLFNREKRKKMDYNLEKTMQDLLKLKNIVKIKV